MISSNAIILMDGSVIEGFPKEDLDNIDANTIPREKRQRWHKLFCNHIQLFLDNADRILSDSRMFLAPVKILNGIGYIGSSGFKNATLGVYIEFWLRRYEASHDVDGNPIWYIGGSPLSGKNLCEAVTPEGKSIHARLRGRFIDTWPVFQEINSRYTDAKARFRAYTLQQVINILSDERP